MGAGVNHRRAPDELMAQAWRTVRDRHSTATARSPAARRAGPPTGSASSRSPAPTRTHSSIGSRLPISRVLVPGHFVPLAAAARRRVDPRSRHHLPLSRTRHAAGRCVATRSGRGNTSSRASAATSGCATSPTTWASSPCAAPPRWRAWRRCWRRPRPSPATSSTARLAGIDVFAARATLDGPEGIDLYCRSRDRASLQKTTVPTPASAPVTRRRLADLQRLEWGIATVGIEIDPGDTPIEAGLESPGRRREGRSVSRARPRSHARRRTGAFKRLVGFHIVGDDVPAACVRASRWPA